MKSIIRTAALVAGCASLSACATVTRGPHTNWEVKTSPPGASVQTSNGKSCASTPCTIRTSRRAHFTATISKPGYKPVNVEVTHGMSARGGVALAGNAVIGGVIGVVVDLSTGATNDLKPRKADLTLQKDDTYQAIGQVSMPSDLAPPIRRDTSSLQRHADANTQPDRQGRVIAIRVLPDGSVAETRSPYN
jgi:hypothetical protein